MTPWICAREPHFHAGGYLYQVRDRATGTVIGEVFRDDAEPPTVWCVFPDDPSFGGFMTDDRFYRRWDACQDLWEGWSKG